MNRGIEVSVNTVNVDNKNFKWNSTLTFAANHEEITDLIDGKDIIGSDSHITTSLLIGRPLKSFYHLLMRESGRKMRLKKQLNILKIQRRHNLQTG